MTKICLAAVGLLLLILEAQSGAATPSDAVGAASAAQPHQSVATGDDTLRNEVAELRRKIEKPPKDVWDKISSVSGLASGLAVALIGFYATNIYNKRQRIADDRRKDQAIDLEKAKFEAQTELEKAKFAAQKEIEEVKFGYEQRRWRESLVSQIALKHVEARLTDYSSLWSRMEIVATHRWASNELTRDLARELADYIKKWRYSTGGLLAEPTTRHAAYVFQQVVGNYNETKESYSNLRVARLILRDALRADMGVSEDISGKSLIDVAAERQRITTNLTDLQTRLGIPPASVLPIREDRAGKVQD